LFPLKIYVLKNTASTVKVFFAKQLRGGQKSGQNPVAFLSFIDDSKASRDKVLADSLNWFI